MNNRKEDLNKILTACENFKNAWVQCEEVFCEVDESTLNDVICSSYPFQLSFDEQCCEVVNWYWNVVENIQKEFKSEGE